MAVMTAVCSNGGANMTINEKKSAILAELRSQVSDIVADLMKEHQGMAEYEKVRDNYHELAAQNITPWDDLTWDIDELEEELSDTPFNPDPETGWAGAEHDYIFQKLADKQEDAEEWADVFEHTFEDFWGRLEEAIYGEEG